MLLNLGTAASRIRERMDRTEDGVHVPHLFEIEVMSVLRRYALRREFSERRSAELLGGLATMDVT